MMTIMTMGISSCSATGEQPCKLCAVRFELYKGIGVLNGRVGQ